MSDAVVLTVTPFTLPFALNEEVGNLQIDYVEHCGRSNGGEYVHTLSGGDIASGWWEGEAIASRGQQATKDGMEAIRARLPFRIKEVQPNNRRKQVKLTSSGEIASSPISRHRSGAFSYAHRPGLGTPTQPP